MSQGIETLSTPAPNPTHQSPGKAEIPLSFWIFTSSHAKLSCHAFHMDCGVHIGSVPTAGSGTAGGQWVALAAIRLVISQPHLLTELTTSGFES